MLKVLITGAGGTIGKALVKRLQDDYQLVLHDYKKNPTHDFSSYEGVSHLITAVQENSFYAVIHTVGPFSEENDPETWQRLFQTNVISAQQLAATLNPDCFITFGVAGLLLPARKMVAYLACKNALMSLTKSLAASGMRANMVCLGGVIGSKYVPAGPLVEAEEIADLVAFLLSSPHITGQIIDCAGGIRF